jgi:hypothetical protein|nr:hypothetical protein [uncultured Sphingomonas sp.]
MRSQLFAFLVAFAVLWCGTGGSALACSVDGPASALVAVDAVDQAASDSPDDSEKQSKPSGQAAAHHHCYSPIYSVNAPLEELLSLREAPAKPAASASLSSFAQAPPVQPPAA